MISLLKAKNNNQPNVEPNIDELEPERVTMYANSQKIVLIDETIKNKFVLID